MIALHHRGETGEGQVVDASLFAGNMYGAALQLDAYLAMRDDRLSVPVARLDAGNPMSGAGLAYPTSDGRWITLTMPDSDRWWPSFSEVMGLDENDPRFDSHDKRCGEGRVEMMAILDESVLQAVGCLLATAVRRGAPVGRRHGALRVRRGARPGRDESLHPGSGTPQLRHATRASVSRSTWATPRLGSHGWRPVSVSTPPRSSRRSSAFPIPRSRSWNWPVSSAPPATGPHRSEVRERRETGRPRASRGAAARVTEVSDAPTGRGARGGAGAGSRPCGSRVRCVPSTLQTSVPR